MGRSTFSLPTIWVGIPLDARISHPCLALASNSLHTGGMPLDVDTNGSN